MKSLLISGYRSYELNIFNQTDSKYLYLMKFIKNRLTTFIENGVEWFVIGGQLGIELWAGEIVIELQEKYPDIKLGVILPYNSFEENWNETNQILFQQIIQKADYVNYTSNEKYQSPAQLVTNQVFNIRNTDGAFLIYDTLTEATADSKPKYLFDLIKLYQETEEYELHLATFEEIEFFIHEYNELNN